MRERMRRFFPWVSVAIWMFVIFYLSHQPASVSSGLSSGIAATIIGIIQHVFSLFPIDADAVHHLIRKGAYFFAYFVLGMLVIHALRLPYLKGAAFALFICVLYAISDEVHQLFIPGRSGEMRDVLIDSAGAAAGIGAYALLGRIFRAVYAKTTG